MIYIPGYNAKPQELGYEDVEGNWVPNGAVQHLSDQLAAAEARIEELVEALDAMVSYARAENKGLKMADDALSRQDNLEALRGYRNGVIDECLYCLGEVGYLSAKDKIRALKEELK